jgi:hypothetical protein
MKSVPMGASSVVALFVGIASRWLRSNAAALTLYRSALPKAKGAFVRRSNARLTLIHSARLNYKWCTKAGFVE